MRLQGQRSKLDSIHRANTTAAKRSSRWQFTLFQFFTSTLVFALVVRIFMAPLFSLAIAITIYNAIDLTRNPFKWKLWLATGVAWVMCLAFSIPFWRWLLLQF